MTRGIAFMGTPHEGSDLARWAELGLNFIKLNSAGKEKRDIEVLKKDSAKLGDIGDSFASLVRKRGESSEQAQRISVVCFFEELETRISKAKINIGTVCNNRASQGALCGGSVLMEL